MANESNKPPQRSDAPFLGGGPKFNQAGLNTPMPGERTADVPPPPPFGGPRVWAGVVIVVVLIAVLWFVYGSGQDGLRSRGGHTPVSAEDRPTINPDASQ